MVCGCHYGYRLVYWVMVHVLQVQFSSVHFDLITQESSIQAGRRPH